MVGNPNHDSRTGQFTFGSGGGSGEAGKGEAETLFDKNLAAEKDETLDQAVDRVTDAKTRASINKVVAELQQGEQSKIKFSDENGVYTPERQAIHDQIIRDAFTEEKVRAATPAPGEKPLMFVTGGRPGSGKTTGLKNLGVDPDKFIGLNTDDVAPSLPGYQPRLAALYHNEAGDIVTQIAGTARRSGLNVLVDTTMRSIGGTKQYVQEFRDAGYRTEAMFMHVTPAISVDRVIKRFDGGAGRYVELSYAWSSRTNERNFDTIKRAGGFDKWALFDNNGSAPKLVAQG